MGDYKDDSKFESDSRFKNKSKLEISINMESLTSGGSEERAERKKDFF